MSRLANQVHVFLSLLQPVHLNKTCVIAELTVLRHSENLTVQHELLRDTRGTMTPRQDMNLWEPLALQDTLKKTRICSAKRF